MSCFQRSLQRCLLVLCFITLSFHVSSINGEFDTGFARSMSGFAFLGKFCFGITPPSSPDPAGSITIRLAIDAHIAPAPKSLRLLIFDDEPESWPSIYHHETMKCEEKMQHALLNVPVNFPSDTWVWEHQGLVFEHTRPRFWYVVLANCQQIDFVVYNLVFVNSAVSSWQREFGVNEQGLNNIYIAFFVISFALLVVHCYGLRLFWQRESGGLQAECTSGFASVPALHRTFTAGLLILSCALLFEVIHLASFAYNGFGSPILHLMANLMRIGAQLLLLFLLLLLASGWSISTESVPNKALIGAVFSGFGLLYCLLFFWAAARDRASTLYLYDSFPGYCIAASNIVCGILFVIWLKNSREEEPAEDKRSFYLRLGVCYSFWFFSQAIVVLFSTWIPSWEREKSVTALQLGVDTLAYSGMIWLLWPTRMNDYFKTNVPSVGDEYDSLINETM